eukprot:SM000264S09760  [mRNA]  locus=s264:3462:10604:- [translate_table: standard]
MSSLRSPWDYNQMFWQAVKQSLAARNLGEYREDEKDLVEMLEGRVAPKDLSPRQMCHAAEMMELHWDDTCWMPRKMSRFQAIEGPHSPNETIIHMASAYSIHWFDRLLRLKDVVVEPLPDFAMIATIRRAQFRMRLQPQDPSWRHVVVISIDSRDFVAGSMTPFVAELLQMLRGNGKQVQEESLEETGAPGRGYFEHVIKEQRVTLYETVGTLKERFANGILFLADLVIVCGESDKIFNLEQELEPRDGAALALAYVLRDQIQCTFCVLSHFLGLDIGLEAGSSAEWTCRDLLRHMFRFLESIGSMSSRLGMCLDLPTPEEFVELSMQHSFPSGLQASLAGQAQPQRPKTSPSFPVFLHGTSSDKYVGGQGDSRIASVGALVEQHLLLLRLICSPRESGAATTLPWPSRDWDLPEHPVQGSTGADAAEIAAVLPFTPMLAPQAEGPTLEKNSLTEGPMEAEQTNPTEHILPTFSNLEAPGAARDPLHLYPSGKAVPERSATAVPQLPSAPCAADNSDMRRGESLPARPMDKGDAWAGCRLSVSAERQVVGLRFAPTDEELVVHYLRSRLAGKLTEQEKILIPDKDVFETEPWKLTSTSCRVLHDAYFFCALRRKYREGSEKRKGDYNRQAGKGKWKGCSTMTMPLSGVTATKRIFTYYSEDQEPIDPVPEVRSHVEESSTDTTMQQAAAPDAVEVSISSKKRVRKGSARNSKTKWILHEYHIVDHQSTLNQSTASQDEIVVCKLKYTAEDESASITTELEKLDVNLSGSRSSSAKCALCSPLAWYGNDLTVDCRRQLAMGEAGATVNCTAGSEIEGKSLDNIHENWNELDEHVKKGKIDQAGGEWSRNLLPASTGLSKEGHQQGALMGGCGRGATLGEQDLVLRLGPATAAASPQKQNQTQSLLDKVITDDEFAPWIDHHGRPADHDPERGAEHAGKGIYWFYLLSNWIFRNLWNSSESRIAEPAGQVRAALEEAHRLVEEEHKHTEEEISRAAAAASAEMRIKCENELQDAKNDLNRAIDAAAQKAKHMQDTLEKWRQRPEEAEAKAVCREWEELQHWYAFLKRVDNHGTHLLHLSVERHFHPTCLFLFVFYTLHKEASTSSKRPRMSTWIKSDWVMHEYNLSNKQPRATQNEIVICKLIYTHKRDIAATTTGLEDLDANLSSTTSLATKCALCHLLLACAGKSFLHSFSDPVEGWQFERPRERTGQASAELRGMESAGNLEGQDKQGQHWYVDKDNEGVDTSPYTLHDPLMGSYGDCC